MDIEPILYNYTTILMTEEGKRYDISNLIENLGWEEPEKELAARITFTAKNDKVSKSRLSSLAVVDLINYQNTDLLACL